MSSNTKSNVAVLVWHLKTRQAEGCGSISGHPKCPRAQLDVHSLLPTAGLLNWVFGGEEQPCHHCVHEKPCAGAGVVWHSRCPTCSNLQALGFWFGCTALSLGVVVILRKNYLCYFHGLGETCDVGKGWGWSCSSPDPLTAQGHSAEPPEAAPSLWIWGWLQEGLHSPWGHILWHSSEATAGLCSNQMSLGSCVGWFSSFLCISKQSVQIPVLQLTEKI